MQNPLLDLTALAVGLQDLNAGMFRSLAPVESDKHITKMTTISHYLAIELVISNTIIHYILNSSAFRNHFKGCTHAGQPRCVEVGVNLSTRTVGKVFKKHELPDGDAGAAEARYRTRGDDKKEFEQQVEKEMGQWERFCRPNPNDLWQMDIMSFYIRDAHRVHLISALDDCSRMIVGWGLFREQTADNVLEVLRGALVRFGVPKEILTDQGAQFKQWGGVTRFEKLLKKLKVEHIKARAHHPQTCGKIEAFHKSIHRELIDKEFFVTQEQAVEKIGRFIEHYNYGRPHSALDGFTPSDRYFGIIEALKKYIADYQAPKNKQEETGQEQIGVARGSKLYLIGKVLGHDVRLQELGGQLSIHLDQRPFKEVNLLAPLQTEAPSGTVQP